MIVTKIVGIIIIRGDASGGQGTDPCQGALAPRRGIFLNLSGRVRKMVYARHICLNFSNVPNCFLKFSVFPLVFPVFFLLNLLSYFLAAWVYSHLQAASGKLFICLGYLPPYRYSPPLEESWRHDYIAFFTSL